MIFQMNRLYEDYCQFRTKRMNAKKSSHFVNKLDRLFDIVKCQCVIYKCSGGEACFNKEECSGYHVKCKCLVDFIIPDQEVAFIKDQREKIRRDGGQMAMEGKDFINARKLKEELEELKEEIKHENALKVETVVTKN